MSSIGATNATQKTIDQIISANEANKMGERNTGVLGKDDFLQLLITQLQHQDPMNPSSDTEFIAQVAQFSSLEQMQNMNSATRQQQAFSMIGKYISGTVSADEGGDARVVSGQVTGVRMSEGKILLVVGENEVPLDGLLEVSDSAEGVGGDTNLNQYNTLIGLMGTASLTDGEGRTKAVDGIVSKLERLDGGIVATLDEVELLPVIDKGAFETEEAYLEAMIGRTVSLRVRDAATGADLTVSGTLRQHEVAEDGKLHVILDGVQVPVTDITATRRVDLFSSEQLLLAKILQQLVQMNGTGETQEEGTDGAPPVEEDPAVPAQSQQ
jgi:flagellar basal-body rod modification protein FlgD